MTRVLKFMETQLGFPITVTQVKSDWQNQLNLALSGGTDIDVIHCKGMDALIDLKAREAIKPITSSLKKYGKKLMEVLSPEMWLVVTDENGEIWGIPEENVFRKTFETLSIRKDWREKLGMGPITTLDELEAYLVAVKDADLDGNKTADTVPIATSRDLVTNINAVFQYLWTEQPGTGHNGTGNYLDANGNITPIVLHPEYINCIAKFADWYTKGLLYKENFKRDQKKIEDLIISNRLAAVFGWYSDYIRPLQKLQATVPEAEFEYVALKTVKGNAYKYAGYVPARPVLALVSYSNQGDHFVKFINWLLSSPQNLLVSKWGVPGVDFEYDAKDNLFVDLKPDLKPAEKFNYAISLFNYVPYNPAQTNMDFVNIEYKKSQDWMGTNDYVVNPDWYIPYNWAGTPIANASSDAQILINEAIARIISGQDKVADWPTVIEKYMSIYGTGYIKEATAQYNAKKQKK